MINIMMRLGAFNFSISTAAYQAFTRSSGYRWQGQDRYGQGPAQQFTGYEAETITLEGDIYPDYAGGIGQIDNMRAEAGKGIPLMLLDGRGYVWGKWVINSIRETQEVFFSDGVPRKQSFTLQLTRYGDDL